MLQVTHVSKKFKDADVLKDVSLTVKPGELIHIVGINGSGKSTLFKIITGLLKADRGTVSLDSGDVIRALIENPGFLEYETAWANLRFLANVHHKFQEDKVRKLLTDFDLDPDSQQSRWQILHRHAAESRHHPGHHGRPKHHSFGRTNPGHRQERGQTVCRPA